MTLLVKDLKRVLANVEDDVHVFVDLGGAEGVWPATVRVDPVPVSHTTDTDLRRDDRPGLVLGVTQDGPWRIVE